MTEPSSFSYFAWRYHNKIQSARFFQPNGGIENLIDLTRITIICGNLIDTRGVLNILNITKKLQYLRVTFIVDQKDENIDQLISRIPNIEFVHLEMKMKGEKPTGLRFERGRYYDFDLTPEEYLQKYPDHLITIERSSKKKNLMFGIFSRGGIKRRKLKEGEEKEGEEKEGEKKEEDHIFPVPIYPAIENVTNNLGILVRNNAINRIQIFYKEIEKDLVLDWNSLEEILVDDLNFKRMENIEQDVKVFDCRNLDVNGSRVRDIIGESERAGDGSLQKIERRVILQEYELSFSINKL